jgi:hypothetical protein
MGKIISTSLDLTKLTSSRFTTPKGAECLLITLDQPGIFVSEKGPVYLNATIFENDRLDNYGNSHAIAIQQTKSQRESGQKRVYLGNGKPVGGGQSNQLAQTERSAADYGIHQNNSKPLPPASDDMEDDLPF